MSEPTVPASSDSPDSSKAPSQETSPQASFLSRMFWNLCKSLSCAIGVIFWDLRIYHIDRCPTSGRCLIAPNHQSFIDPWVMGQVVPGATHFLARETLFKIPILGRLIAALNARPVTRGSQAARQGMETSIQALKENNRLVLFPEGTRSEDGQLQELKRGIYMIAKKSESMVLPVYVDGSFEVWPKHRKFPRLGPLRIFFGEPISMLQSDDQRESKKAVKKGGDLDRLVEDGWAQDRANSDSNSPPNGVLQDSASEGESPSESAPVKKSKKASADFLRQLTEALRALETEAKEFRKDPTPPTVRRR